MASTWTSAGALMEASDAAEVRDLMRMYAQAAQAHDIASPYFALKIGVDHGLCLISIKLNSAVFFSFDGAASITTSGIYLRKGDHAIEGVEFTHTVQLTPNGPEFIASEEAESTVLSPEEFFQRMQPCSFSSTGSLQASLSDSVQAADSASVEASGGRTPSPAFSASTPLPQHDLSRPEEPEACQKDVSRPQPMSFQAADNLAMESSGCRPPSPAFSAVTPLPQHDISRPDESEICQKDVPGPQPAVHASVPHQASDSASVEALGPKSTSPAFTADAPLPRRKTYKRGKFKASQKDHPPLQPAVLPSMSIQASEDVPVEASAAGTTSPNFTAERSLPQRKSSRRQKSKAGQKDVPAPQPAVPGVSTQASDNAAVESSGVRSSSRAVTADPPLPQHKGSRQEKAETGQKGAPRIQPAVPPSNPMQASDNASVESSGVGSSSPAVSADTPLPQHKGSRQEKPEAGQKQATQPGRYKRHERHGRHRAERPPRMQQTS